jgi:arylformamidase
VAMHTSGTHTECAAHLLPGARTLAETGLGTVMGACLLVTVRPMLLAESRDAYDPGAPEDLAVTSEAVAHALEALGGVAEERAGWDAVLVRTSPNDESKVRRAWSGTNPPYLTPAAVRLLIDKTRLSHLLVDLPSLDRESDRGRLLAHRAFFFPPELGVSEAAVVDGTAPMPARTVTELCFAPDSAPDGPYVLSLSIAPIHLDAATSRPVLYPILFTDPDDHDDHDDAETAEVLPGALATTPTGTASSGTTSLRPPSPFAEKERGGGGVVCDGDECAFVRGGDRLVTGALIPNSEPIPVRAYCGVRVHCIAATRRRMEVGRIVWAEEDGEEAIEI